MPRLAASLPEEPPSDPAREGTCAAWLAEMVLRGEVSKADEMVGESHENGWLIEDDMAHHIQGYVDHLTSRGGQIHVERKVRLNEMIAGTPDAFATAVSTERDMYDLFVDDLKYGYDIVDPYRNTQVSIYAGAIMRKFRGKIRRVVIGIYQPRAWHPQGIYRTWELWPENLSKFVREIEASGHDCQATDSKATPGFHCEHCPVAGSCVALTHSIYKGWRVISDERQGTLTGRRLAEEIEFIDMMEKMVKARRSQLRAEATARIKAGQFVPDYGFEEAFGNRKFTADAMTLMVQTGVDPYEDRKLCTPAELIRRTPKGRRKEVEKIIEGMTTRPRIPPKLVKYDQDHFKRLFGKKGT